VGERIGHTLRLTNLLNYDGWIDDVVFYRGTY